MFSSAKGRAWLAKTELPARARTLIDSDLRLLAACEAELATLDRTLVEGAYAEPRVRLLMTLPGVDYTVALALVAVLGDSARFSDGDHAAAYLGLVPSTHQSGEHRYHGRITKRGNRRARWLLIQAAQLVASHPGPLGVFFRRLLKKKNRNIAVVATVRKLVVIAWQMLQENEPYRYAQPAATEAKLSRLRVKATGRRSEPAKGSAPAANQGTGKRSRTVRSLPELYEVEGLPSTRGPEQLPAAEARVLAAAGVSEYVQEIQQPRQRERKRRAAATESGAAAGNVT